MAFDNFRVVPPGTGICHQVNLEYLAQVVWTKKDGETIAYPDTLVGTDSHTTMVNGLGVLGWGVGGIEAEAAMLGQPHRCSSPTWSASSSPASCRGRDRDRPGADGHPDAAQEGRGEQVRRVLRRRLADLPLADRATIANMAPEYGATCGFFPIDEITLATSRPPTAARPHRARRGLCQGAGPVALQEAPEPVFTDTLSLDMGDVVPSLAGPKRPQDRVPLSEAAQQFVANMEKADRKATAQASRCEGAGPITTSATATW
jgi:aconitate hydratase